MNRVKKIDLLTDIIRFEPAVKSGVHDKDYWECKRYRSAKAALACAGVSYGFIIREAHKAADEIWDIPHAVDYRGAKAFHAAVARIEELV